MADGGVHTLHRDWAGVTPPAQPFPPPLFLYHFVRNPLRCLPQSVYERPITPYNMGPVNIVWVTDPALTETVFLGKHEVFPKPPLEQRVFSQPLGKSILTSQGEDWKWQRQAVSSLFRHSTMLSYVPDMAQAAEDLIAKWRSTTSRTITRRIDRDLTRTTYAAISKTLFGGVAMPELADIQAGVEGYLMNTPWEIVAALSGAPEGGWHPGRSNLDRASAKMRDAASRLLDRWRARGDQPGEDHLLGRLLQAEELGRNGEISRDRLLNNLLTFLNAGHETTAKALIWALYVLSMETGWQARVRREIEEIVGDDPVSGEHIEQLTLTRQAFEEAMRLYAPAPVLTRLATEDCRLGDVDVKAGTLIFIPIWAVHRHKALWDEPDAFRPDRFAPEARAEIKRTQYMPFGFGPRICIGSSFAIIEGVAMLASLLRGARFSWTGDAPPEPLARVTLWPKGGMSLKVELLDRR